MKTGAPIQFLRSGPAGRDKDVLPDWQFAIRNPQFPWRLLFIIFTLALFGTASVAQTISPASLPLYFQANNDQTEFLSSGNGCQFTVSASGVQMTLRESAARAATAQMRFAGANAAAQLHGGGEMTGKINYLIGNDSSKWQTGLSTFGNVQVTELYPGINMVFHGNQRQLEYDFTIAPGANLNAIKMQFQGVGRISITPDGDLVVRIGSSEIRQPKPEIYQTISGARKTIDGGYKILDSRTVAFEVAGYDHSLPLVIDPVLGYSTFFGGNVSDTAWVMALDPNNSIYIAGDTFSTKFSTVGAVQTNYAGAGAYYGDAFVAKLDQTGTNLIYLTYLGGSGNDAAIALAVDSTGNAFLGGYTDSKNFPTNNALYQTIPTVYSSYYGFQPASGFVTELNTNGTRLIYSTYLGGASDNLVEAIAVDSSDNAYAVGLTYSTNFPVTTNALLTHLAGTNGTVFLNANGFVTEIASNDSKLVYSTYFGGTNYDVATGVAVDPSNYVYVAGYTASFNFPTWNTPTNLPYGRHLNGLTNQTSIFYTYDGFAAKFPPLTNQISSKTNLIYSTFLGGTNNDMAYGIAADASGNAYVTGWTASTNFPVINSPPGLTSFLTTNSNPGLLATNVFLTKITPDGSAVLGSTVFGGNVNDIGSKVAVDLAGDAFVVGTETSITNFPTKNAFGSLLSTNSSGTGVHDAFVTGISADWSNVLYSVCIGGNQDTFGYGIALDSSTNVFIAGGTDSTNYPALNTGRFSFNGTNVINGTNYINGARFTGTNDAFLTEITFATTVPVVSIEPTNEIVGFGATATFSATVSGTTEQLLYQWQTNGVNLVNPALYRGTNSSMLIITNAQPGESDTNYGLVVSYAGGSLVESNANLTVLDMPYIEATSATNLVVPVGTNVSFSVTVSGSPLFYLWSTNNAVSFLTNNAQISGATNATLSITDVQTNNSGIYTVFPYNGITAFTNANFFLTVVEPLSVVTAPSNQTVNAGATVSLAVVASGYPLNYQWSTNDGATFLTNGTNNDGSTISGSTTSTLTITNAQPADGGTYTVFINNGLQYTNFIVSTNLSATLTVTPIPGAVFTGFSPAAGGIGNGMVLSGTGGATNGSYYVLTSSNLLVPVQEWTPIATNQFDNQGQFIFTNPVSTNASQFFILKQP